MKIVFDIGGTNIRAGLFSKEGMLVAKRVEATPQDYETGIAQMKSMAGALLSAVVPKKVAIVIAGVLDRREGTILVSPNLSGWERKPLGRDLARTLGVPVTLENDAVAAGLGEARFGAGKGNRIVAYLTISTGIGGAKIVDGQVDANAWGFEPGNQIINMKETKTVGNFRRGTWESYASGTAFAKRYGVSPKACTDPAIWKDFTVYLAAGITNMIVLWSPDIVVLGGGVTRSGKMFLSSLRRQLEKLVVFPRKPPIVIGSLGDDAGLWGGSILLA